MKDTINKESRLELSTHEMTEFGYSVVDAIVQHMDGQNEKRPVTQATREEMDRIFLEEAPESPLDSNEVLNFVLEKVLKPSPIVSHPKFYSFVPGPSNYVSVMADALATGFNIFSGGWMASPAAAELEIVSIGWLLRMFGLPFRKGGGIFTSGGSMANLTAIATARRIKCGDDFSKAVIYLSDQAHSSNIKAIRILGFTKHQVRIIPTDMEFKISLNKLKNAIARDKIEGLNPFCLIASAGTTNTGSVDPLDVLATLCKKEDIWFHIDGAYGGFAILSKKGKLSLKGIEKADSLTVDPHKWFFQPYEIGCLLVRNSKWLKSTFTEKPEYLRDIEGNTSELNFYDHGIELTRRFRALKFYMSIKTFGLTAFRKAITYNIELAEAVEELLRTSGNWEIISPATLAVINFRYNPIGLELDEERLDALNHYISDRIIQTNDAMLATTVINKQVVLRMCLINPRSTLKGVTETLNLCTNIAKEKYPH